MARGPSGGETEGKGLSARFSILIMSCHWQGALACLQSFGQRGHEITLVAWDESGTKLHGQSDYVSDIVYHAPAATPEEDVPWLLELIAARGIDLVVPISDHDASVVALAAKAAEPGSPQAAALFAPSPESLALARDRTATVALCERLGIATPRSQTVEAEALRDVVPGWGFPLFLKVDGVAGLGVSALRNEADFERFLASGPTGTVQIQEAVDGDFVGVTGVCRNGEVLSRFGFCTDYEFSFAGTPPYALRDENAVIDDYLARIAGALHWTGGIDLDCLARPDGTLVVLEINPRISGTVNFALACGRDVPAGYLALRQGAPVASIFEDTGASLFASLEQETRFRVRGGKEARRRARVLRASHVVADNGYPQDRGYARALWRARMMIRLDGLFDPIFDRVRRVLP